MGFFRKFLGCVNFALGAISLVIQIVAMTSPDGEHIPNLNITVELPSEDYGAGIWCGIAFLLCGYVAFRYDSSFNSKGKSESSGFERLGFISIFIIAILCGIAQIIIAGITLNDIKILQDCLKENHCPCNAVLGGFFCSSHTAYHAVLITSGLLGIATNILLLLPVMCRC